jgi:hypothetical protein
VEGDFRRARSLKKRTTGDHPMGVGAVHWLLNQNADQAAIAKADRGARCRCSRAARRAWSSVSTGVSSPKTGLSVIYITSLRLPTAVR